MPTAQTGLPRSRVTSSNYPTRVADFPVDSKCRKGQQQEAKKAISHILVKKKTTEAPMSRLEKCGIVRCDSVPIEEAWTTFGLANSHSNYQPNKVPVPTETPLRATIATAPPLLSTPSATRLLRHPSKTGLSNDGACSRSTFSSKQQQQQQQQPRSAPRLQAGGSLQANFAAQEGWFPPLECMSLDIRNQSTLGSFIQPARSCSRAKMRPISKEATTTPVTKVTDRSKRDSSSSLYSSSNSCPADPDQKYQSQQRRGSRISRLLRLPLQQRQQKSQTEDASVPLRRQLTLLLGRASSDPQGPYAIASSEPKSQRRMQEIQVAQRSNDPNDDSSVRGHSLIFEQKEERRRVSSTGLLIIEQQEQACRSLPTRSGLARKAPLVTMQPGLQQQPPLPLEKASATVPLLPEPPARPDEANILWNQLEKELGVKLGSANTPSSSQSKSVERHKMTITPHQYSSPTKPTERLRPPARSRASRIPVPSRRLLCTDSGIAPTLVQSSLSCESLPRARPFKTSLKYRKASFDCSKRPPVQAKPFSVRCQSRLPATTITKPVPSSSTDPLVYIAAGESLTRAHSCTSTLWSEPSCYSGVSDSTMPSSMPITPTKPRAPGNAETPPSPTPAPPEEIVEMFLDMLRSEQREGFRCDGESFGSPAPSTAPSWRQAWHVATQEREYIGVLPERERRKRIEAIQAMEKWRG